MARRKIHRFKKFLPLVSTSRKQPVPGSGCLKIESAPPEERETVIARLFERSLDRIAGEARQSAR